MRRRERRQPRECNRQRIADAAVGQQPCPLTSLDRDGGKQKRNRRAGLDGFVQRSAVVFVRSEVTRPTCRHIMAADADAFDAVVQRVERRGLELV